MSAHCHDCGTDMVFGTGEDWQLMTCPVCSLRERVEQLLEALKLTPSYLKDCLAACETEELRAVVEEDIWRVVAAIKGVPVDDYKRSITDA